CGRADSQAVCTSAEVANMPSNPKAFMSYSWQPQAHKEWARELAARLRGDGVDVTLDQWATAPGDQLPQFMERAVRENDLILVLCTPEYKVKSLPAHGASRRGRESQAASTAVRANVSSEG